MRIAVGSTTGANILNLQLGVWRHAVAQFEELRRAGEGHRTALLTTPENDADEYTWNEFEPDAAVAVLLAGISLNQLLGHHAKPRPDGKPPSFRKCIREIMHIENDLPADWEEVVCTYDRLRHFGPPHYPTIMSLSPAKLEQLMKTAQAMWVCTLNKLDIDVPNKDFSHEFDLCAKEV